MGNMDATPFAVSPELGDALAKVAVFALVYLVLRKSSDVFAPGRTPSRSLSFRPMRSMSVRRVLRRPRRRPGGRRRRRAVAFAAGSSGG
ncbi:hypothetical protein C2845_PM10G05770 [Panicum miliaceum]|uniref:Uncharacterized protein n=1 Tax=Panicum miliaceum TaxID=4540 RepID=A0A3L6PC68_PANMI|nr:hypothetical protein C2845_PM10G05770 [Panicum miliaceum]